MYLEFNRQNKTMKIYTNSYNKDDFICVIPCDEYCWLTPYKLKMFYNNNDMCTIEQVYYVRMK